MSEILVTTANELSYELKKSIESKIQTKFGNNPIKYIIDPSLIFGLIIKVGDEEFYYNVRHEISHILNELLH